VVNAHSPPEEYRRAPSCARQPQRTIGQAVCSAAVAAVLASHTRAFSGGVTAPTLDGYRTGFAMAGSVALLACATACLIPRQAPQPHPVESETFARRPQPLPAHDLPRPTDPAA
jgi:hypothetical protein